MLPCRCGSGPAVASGFTMSLIDRHARFNNKRRDEIRTSSDDDIPQPREPSLHIHPTPPSLPPHRLLLPDGFPVLVPAEEVLPLATQVAHRGEASLVRGHQAGQAALRQAVRGECHERRAASGRPAVRGQQGLVGQGVLGGGGAPGQAVEELGYLWVPGDGRGVGKEGRKERTEPRTVTLVGT